MVVLAGVPQGSILCPPLFLLFIYDIVKCIGASIRLFADDTSLYIIVDLTEHLAIILNTDLKTISDWANSWLIAVNTSKALSMIFSRKFNPVVHPSLFMHDTMINETTNHKSWVLFSPKTVLGQNISIALVIKHGQGSILCELLNSG